MDVKNSNTGRFMDTSKHCNMIEKGLFVSHRGVSFCCSNSDKTKVDPVFFFTNYKKESLQLMQQNQIVKGCENCFKNEKEKISSKRIEYKTHDDLQYKSNPKIIELDLSNFCNLKCIMCGPTRSSQWAKIDNTDGISAVSKKIIDQVGELSSDLEYLDIQGGEPSIMQEYEYYFKILEEKKIIKNITVNVVTNLTNINTKFYDFLRKFKSVRLSVSIDAYGQANDYIRWPSKFEQINQNLHKICNKNNFENIKKINIMNTINILSMFGYDLFLKWSAEIEKICYANEKTFEIYNSIVKHPSFLSPIIAPKKLKDKFFADIKNFLQANSLCKNTRFRSNITLYAKFIQTNNENKQDLQKFLYEIQSLDSERNKNIVDYIPNFHEYIF